MIDEYAIEDHADAELLKLYGRGQVTKTTIAGGVLKAHWRGVLGQTGYAWFHRGRRYVQDKRARFYVDEDGREFQSLEEITKRQG